MANSREDRLGKRPRPPLGPPLYASQGSLPSAAILTRAIRAFEREQRGERRRRSPALPDPC